MKIKIKTQVATTAVITVPKRLRTQFEDQEWLADEHGNTVNPRLKDMPCLDPADRIEELIDEAQENEAWKLHEFLTEVKDLCLPTYDVLMFV